MREDIDNLWEAAEVKPMVNQVLCPICNTPSERIHYCQEKGIVREAYSPVAYGEILKNKEIAEMAKKYDASVAQLCNRYDILLNTIVLPKAANPDHRRSNADVDFVISDEDRETLKKRKKIESYGKISVFPVYGEKIEASLPSLEEMLLLNYPKNSYSFLTDNYR